MNSTTLHYIYDPLCGWCYGAAPLVTAAREFLRVHAHGGGMMTGVRRQNMTPQLREFVKQNDERIAQLSGQRFGQDYIDGLLSNTHALFDSKPPTAAMLAAEAIAGRGLDMLAELQIAHYVEGRQIADRATLIEVAAALGLDPAAFIEALDLHLGEAVQAHISETRAFMAQVGAHGFPTLVLETKGLLQIVNFADYLGRPQDFQNWLRAKTNALAAAIGAVAVQPFGVPSADDNDPTRL